MPVALMRQPTVRPIATRRRLWIILQPRSGDGIPDGIDRHPAPLKLDKSMRYVFFAIDPGPPIPQPQPVPVGAFSCPLEPVPACRRSPRTSPITRSGRPRRHAASSMGGSCPTTWGDEARKACCRPGRARRRGGEPPRGPSVGPADPRSRCPRGRRPRRGTRAPVQASCI